MNFTLEMNNILNTSLWLILYAESTADSKITVIDMKIVKPHPKSPTNPPKIHKIFRAEISTVIEISTDFESRTIIEYQIFCVISPIYETILDYNFNICLKI